MNGLVKLLLAALGIGVVAVAVNSANKSNGKYRVKYLVKNSIEERTEFYELKADATTGFKKHIKEDSYVSLEERIGESDRWKEIDYNKGNGKEFK